MTTLYTSDLEDFNSNYDLIKNNYPKSWQLVFMLSMYYDRFKFKRYLHNFLREKNNEQLYTLDLYITGNQDSCIAYIDGKKLIYDHKTDEQLYQYLIDYIDPQEDLIEAKQFLEFIQAKIKFLNSKFDDKILCSNTNQFKEFQKEIDIFCSEL